MSNRVSVAPGRRRIPAALVAGAVAVSGSYLLLGADTGVTSSHKEAPLIANDPQADATDLYAFVSPDRSNTVTLIANVVPLQDPAGGPNFYPFADRGTARYNIKIDNDGDAKPDITYRWTFRTIDKRGEVNYPDSDADGSFLYANGPVNSFDDNTLLFKQTYSIQRIEAGGKSTTIVRNAPVAPSRVGDGTMPNYAPLRQEAIVNVRGGGKAFAGQADDPFFIDLRVFDLLYGGDLSERGDNTVAFKNVNTMAIQVPISDLTKGNDPTIGVFATTDRPSMRVQSAAGEQDYRGRMVQVSRLGNPLVNEVVIPVNLKDAFNALAPENDASVDAAVNKVLDPEVPKLIEAVYGIKAKDTPRDDLFTIFLTGVKGLNKPKGEVQPAELLRLNTSIKPTRNPERLGVLVGDNQGFPNGRRLTDDVVDIGLQALAGAVSVDGKGGAPTGVEIVKALAAGDRVNRNDRGFGSRFPYVALPHSGSDPGPGNGSRDSRSSGSRPSGGAEAGVGGFATGSSERVALAAVGLALALALGAHGARTMHRNRATSVR